MKNKTKKNKKHKKTRPAAKSVLTLAVFALVLGGAFVFNIIAPNPETLQSERRKPAAFPKFSADAVISGSFMNAFGKYAADNFIFRDELRTIRAVSVFNVFMQTDKSGLYYDKNVGAGKFDKLNESAVRKTAEKIKKLCEFFPGPDIYFAAVPDKSYYAERYLPGFDLDRALEILNEGLPGVNFIDLAAVMTGKDYYRTDIHWDQARFLRAGGILDALGAAMGFSDRLDKNLAPNSAGDFHGVYAGQLALPLERDPMTYFTGGRHTRRRERRYGACRQDRQKFHRQYSRDIPRRIRGPARAPVRQRPDDVPDERDNK